VSDTAALQAEIDRLRELLLDNDINPDPEPAYVAPFGPPTLSEHLMSQMMDGAIKLMVRQIVAEVPHIYDNEWAKPGAQIGSTLRIRLPE
jgi:hypothetical protein